MLLRGYSSPCGAVTAGGAGVDGTTVSVLLRLALKIKEEDEEERRKVEEKGQRRREFSSLLRTHAQTSRLSAISDEVAVEALSSQPGRRKRKKRKNELPRSSSVARAARTWNFGVSFSSPLYLTVLRPVSVCRQRSTGFGFFWEVFPKCFCILDSGWFDVGYMHMCQSTRAWIFTRFLRKGGPGILRRRISDFLERSSGTHSSAGQMLGRQRIHALASVLRAARWLTIASLPLATSYVCPQQGAVRLWPRLPCRWFRRGKWYGLLECANSWFGVFDTESGTDYWEVKFRGFVLLISTPTVCGLLEGGCTCSQLLVWRPFSWYGAVSGTDTGR